MKVTEKEEKPYFSQTRTKLVEKQNYCDSNPSIQTHLNPSEMVHGWSTESWKPLPTDTDYSYIDPKLLSDVIWSTQSLSGDPHNPRHSSKSFRTARSLNRLLPLLSRLPRYHNVDDAHDDVDDDVDDADGGHDDDVQATLTPGNCKCLTVSIWQAGWAFFLPSPTHPNPSHLINLSSWTFISTNNNLSIWAFSFAQPMYSNPICPSKPNSIHLNQIQPLSNHFSSSQLTSAKYNSI